MRIDRDEPRRERARPHGVLTLVLALVFAVVLTGCPKTPTHKRFPRMEKVPPKEVMEPARAPEAVAGPERAASSKLVERGVLLFEDGNYERAASTFRDAVNVDTTNGVAYYYLAAAHVRMDDPDVALGLLDKADALLGHDEEWSGRIEELRSELGGGASHRVVSSPIDEAF